MKKQILCLTIPVFFFASVCFADYGTMKKELETTRHRTVSHSGPFLKHPSPDTVSRASALLVDQTFRYTP
jgi:hypothetical protein